MLFQTFLILIPILTLWWFQSYILYIPDTYMIYQQTPAVHGIDYEDIYITTRDGVKLHGWFMKQRSSINCPTILFFHGNAGNISYCLKNAKDLYFNTQCNIFLIDYRGYGTSKGIPSERGLQNDASASFEYLMSRRDIDPYKIIVFGHSLGGGVAIELAFREKSNICGVIVENTFTSIEDTIVSLIGLTFGDTLLRYFLRIFLTSRWQSKLRVPDLKVPILFISGLSDELIPPSQMQTLHDLADKSILRKMHYVELGMHNNTYMCDETYYYQIADFINQAVYMRFN